MGNACVCDEDDAGDASNEHLCNFVTDCNFECAPKGNQKCNGDGNRVRRAHLLADESFTMGSRTASKSACRASAVRKRLAPSTMIRDDGVPSGSSISFQFEAFTVEGRPPAGTRASARTRACIELRIAAPSGVSAEVSAPWGPSVSRSSAMSGRLASTRRSSSCIGRPCGSSALALPSAMPTTRTIEPYSRCIILSMLPATSPSGPPVSLTVHGSAVGLMPSERRPESRNTATPSEVTP